MKVCSSPLVDVAAQECTQGLGTVQPAVLMKIKAIFSDFISGYIHLEQCTSLLMPYVGQSKVPHKIAQILSIESTPPLPKYFMRHSDDKSKKRPNLWEPIEDMRLLAAIHKFGLSKWGPVAMFVGGGRTRSQCSQRWNRSLNPGLKKNKWSKDEDAILMMAVNEFGPTSWTKVSKEVGNRCDVQCRYRYLQIMKTGFDKITTDDELPKVELHDEKAVSLRSFLDDDFSDMNDIFPGLTLDFESIQVPAEGGANILM